MSYQALCNRLEDGGDAMVSLVLAALSGHDWLVTPTSYLFVLVHEGQNARLLPMMPIPTQVSSGNVYITFRYFVLRAY